MAVCSRRERGTRVAQVFVNCRFLKRMGAPRPLRGLGHANPTPSLMPHEDRVPKSCPALICRDASCRHLVSGVLAKLRKSHNMQVPAVWLQIPRSARKHDIQQADKGHGCLVVAEYRAFRNGSASNCPAWSGGAASGAAAGHHLRDGPAAQILHATNSIYAYVGTTYWRQQKERSCACSLHRRAASAAHTYRN
eukprot:XP_001690738.1 predicted protein [Chlamydomonas reinhardtii]